MPTRKNNMTTTKKIVIIAALLCAATPAFAATSKELFTVTAKSVVGTFKMEERIPLATVEVFARYYDLDGDTLRVGSVITNTAGKQQAAGLVHVCPELIKKGERATCEVYVRFVRPGTYYYVLNNVSIERPNASDYNPDTKEVFVGAGILNIPLF